MFVFNSTREYAKCNERVIEDGDKYGGYLTDDGSVGRNAQESAESEGCFVLTSWFQSHLLLHLSNSP